MPLELTVIAVTALLAGLLLVAVMLSGRTGPEPMRELEARAPVSAGTARDPDREQPGADTTLRVVWWLTITIVLLGVGISGSFAADQAPIFLLGGAGVLAVVVFHELIGSARRGRLARLVELIAAIALVAGLLALSGYASSPFAALFALVAVAAALGFGPRAGLTAAALSTVAFGVVLLVDPALATYAADDALRLSFGLGASWLLAFVAVAYADRQRRAMRRAIDLSRTDPLTGLFNRSQLFVTLEQEVSRTRRSDRGFCVLMIDLDGLKAINDTGGHLRGDQVLNSLGAVISGSIRTVDSAYRYGGDEFVVLLPETDIVGAFVVAEKIRVGAEELELTLGPESQASVSIGLVSHPEDGLSAEELMVAADRAMYQAKSLGKNQISGNPRPRPALLARRSTLEPPPTVITPAAPEPEPAAPRGEVVEPPGAPPAPADDRAVAVPLGPVVPPEITGRDVEADDAEPDPMEVRRRIATASRSFDPDHQVRRAMDAFFSPSIPPTVAPPIADHERPGPEH
ncbi:MAG TPA: GGDEF domain-containing protein [Candidatus Limnocylindria bacterium]